MREVLKTATRQRLVFAVIGCLGLTLMPLRGGELSPAFGPEEAGSAMFTLNDIYEVINTHNANVTKRDSFAEPSGGPTTGTMRTLDDIMALATNCIPAPRFKTGQTNSVASGDDGDLQLGLEWPTPRFEPVATSGVETNQIRDNLTGLIWAQNADMWGTLTWHNAIANCNNLDYGGADDWRLPNAWELLSLIDFGSTGDIHLPAGHPFTITRKGYNNWTEYWASTTYMSSPGGAVTIGLSIHTSMKNSEDKNNDGRFSAWPVRGGR